MLLSERKNTMKYKMVTIKSCKVFKNREYKIWATQEYIPEHNIGHWKYMIYCRDGSDNILKIHSSCCAPPEGKIDEIFLQKELKKFWQEQKYIGKNRNI